MQVNGVLIAWRSFKQPCAAASSTEVKNVSLAKCIQKM